MFSDIPVNLGVSKFYKDLLLKRCDFIWFQVALLALSSVEGQSCLHIPGAEGFEVLCPNREFTSLSLNQSTFILYLSGLSMHHLNEISFENCTNLRQLHLNDNVLTNASEIPFQLLKRLNYVDLSSNKFSNIDKNLVQQNFVLETLVLSGNKLMLKQNDPILISESLRKLIVSNCGIQEISSNTFNYLPKLETVDLSHNDLRLFSTIAFDETSLTYLTVDETSLHALPENICQGRATINVTINDVMYTLNNSTLCGNKYWTFRNQSKSDQLTSPTGVLEHAMSNNQGKASITQIVVVTCDTHNSDQLTSQINESTIEIGVSGPPTPPTRDWNTDTKNKVVALSCATVIGLIFLSILIAYFMYLNRGRNSATGKSSSVSIFCFVFLLENSVKEAQLLMQSSISNSDKFQADAVCSRMKEKHDSTFIVYWKNLQVFAYNKRKLIV